MAIIAYAVPLVPGAETEAARFGKDVEAHRARYEELNRLGTVKRHMEWIQRTPMGNQLIVVFEVDDPVAINRQFGDDGYDRWWTERVERLHGFDPRTTHPEFPELVWSWERAD